MEQWATTLTRTDPRPTIPPLTTSGVCTQMSSSGIASLIPRVSCSYARWDIRDGLADAVFVDPGKVADRTSRFGWETWAMLALAGLGVLASIGAAAMCLRSRLAEAHLATIFRKLNVDASSPETYNAKVAWWFGTLARLDEAGVALLLARADQAFQADTLTSEVWLLSRNVLTKHRWVNAGWLLAALALTALVGTAASYLIPPNHDGNLARFGPGIRGVSVITANGRLKGRARLPELVQSSRMRSNQVKVRPTRRRCDVFGGMIKLIARPGRRDELDEFRRWDAEVATTKEPARCASTSGRFRTSRMPCISTKRTSTMLPSRGTKSTNRSRSSLARSFPTWLSR